LIDPRADYGTAHDHAPLCYIVAQADGDADN